MSEDPLNLNTQPAGPTPLDDEAVSRMYKSHTDFLAGINEHDPASLFYKRPDRAEAARRDAEMNFQTIMLRAGATPPPPITPESLALEQHNARFASKMPEALAKDIDQRIAAAKGLSREAREAAVAALQKELGELRYAALAETSSPPLDRQTFIRAEGVRQFEELVKHARAARPDLPDDALADAYALRTLANFGRYSAAEKALRPKV